MPNLYTPIYPASFNFLYNGNFDLSQRAIVNNDNAYIVDRWRLLIEAATAATASLSASGRSDNSNVALNLTVGAANNNKFGIFQVIEAAVTKELINNIVSLSAYISRNASALGNFKMAILGWSGTADAVSSDPISAWNADGIDPTLIANWSYLNTPQTLNTSGLVNEFVTYSNSIIPNTINNIAVLIWNDDKVTNVGNITRFSNIKLGINTTKNIIYRPLQLELELCKRFYQKSYPYNIDPATDTASGLIEHYDPYCAGVYNFPVPMRAAPTLTFYDKAGASTRWSLINNGASGLPPTYTSSSTLPATLGSGEISQRGFRVIGTNNGGNYGCFHYTAEAEI